MHQQMIMAAHAADRMARAHEAAHIRRLRRALGSDVRSAAAAGLHRAATRLQPTPGTAGRRDAEVEELRRAA